MLLSTTGVLQDRKIKCYIGVVSGEPILGAIDVIGVDLDYATIGGKGSMVMVVATGTAVEVESL